MPIGPDSGRPINYKLCKDPTCAEDGKCRILATAQEGGPMSEYDIQVLRDHGPAWAQEAGCVETDEIYRIIGVKPPAEIPPSEVED